MMDASQLPVDPTHLVTMEPAQLAALTLGAAWASGLNLYASIFMLGILGANGYIALPGHLAVITDPIVIFAAGFMYVIEFFADKIPGVDSTWDLLHTFVRIPAGAVMAYAATADVPLAVQLAATLLAGGVAATSHFTKAGTRVMINTSPEPFTNIAASFSEDILAVGGLWTALQHPWTFLGLLFCFLCLAAWILPKLFRFLVALFRRIAAWLSGPKPATGPPGAPPG